MAVKFAINVPLQIGFPYGDFLEVDGYYGTQFLYTIEMEDQRDKLYATPALHEQLQELGVGAGERLVITKIEMEGNRKGWEVRMAEVDEKEDAPSNGEAEIPEPDFDCLVELMETSLQTSMKTWQALGGPCTSEDVRAVGISLFLEGCRKGFLPTPMPELQVIHAGNSERNGAP
jgi:hypothetical protein